MRSITASQASKKVDEVLAYIRESARCIEYELSLNTLFNELKWLGIGEDTALHYASRQVVSIGGVDYRWRK